jgi:DNA-binding NarL/FixJ family response regulator
MASPTNLNWSHARQNIAVLVVVSNGTSSNQVRQALKTVGFSSVSASPTHMAALDKIRSRDFPLILFEATSQDIPCVDFVKQTLEMDPNSIMVPISGEPQVDDVFGLLRAGARGFLALPFTVDTLEDVVMRATEGPPLSDAVLNAPDRNAALTGVILNNLYKVSVLMRQAREFPTAARELDRQQIMLAESVDMARLFAEGGDEQLVEKIVEGCIGRANTAATRLGRTRQRLKKQRQAGDEDPAEANA